jgi:signal transduction histidine kinase
MLFIVTGTALLVLVQRLRRVHAQAQAALAQRDQLLATVSHDLKHPLMILLGWTQVLQDEMDSAGSVSAEDLREGLARIEATAGRMSRLIADLLDVAQAQAGQPLPLVRQPLDLGVLAADVVRGTRVASPQRTIHVATGDAPLPCMGDATRLEQVITNLLVNAVAYSAEDTEIVVRLRREGQDWAIFEVQDQGQGIPATDLPHIFEPFYQASNASAGAGRGLGLAIVRQIVEQHAGTVTAQSQLGRGTIMTVRLPLA